MLSPDHIDWLQHERGIDPEVAISMGLYSVARGVDGDAVESPNGRILAFPFFRHGEEVNTKYRDPHDKSRMWQRKGGQHILFNRDCLLDPALEEGRLPLVITEGEIDCLTAAQVGFPLSTSVPDGAPPARDRNGALIAVPEGTADIDPETDHKFGFVLEAWPLLSKVKRIILAVDDDEPGHRLRDELARRLGRARCEFVTYPAEPVVPDEHGELRRCKDLNEVLVYLGQKAVQDILFGAKPMPVAGLYGEADFPPEQPIEAVSTGWPRLDDHLRLYTPCLMVVTGFANHGKSTWTTQLAANVALLHRWPVTIASFEMRKSMIDRTIRNALIAKVGGGQAEAFQRARQIQRDYFSWIAPQPDCEDALDIDWLLERATAAVLRHGTKVLLVDPWNEIEHSRDRSETMTEYTSRALRKLKRWAHQMDVLVIVVAHPSKGAIHKEAHEVTLYDVADSAHWANKPDLGVVIARLGENPEVDTLTAVAVRKVRYQPDAGKLGTVEITFDPKERIFSE